MVWQEVMRDGLFPYQKQGLAWMLKQEAAAHGPHGGMLCDEPGVGKTMQGIALIASNQCPSEEVRLHPTRPLFHCDVDLEGDHLNNSRQHVGRFSNRLGRVDREQSADDSSEQVGDLGDEWTADRLKSNSLACSSTARSEESPSDSDVATSDESAMDASSDPVGWDELLRVKGTLVVMPKGLLGQWNAALTEWVSRSILSAPRFYGSP